MKEISLNILDIAQNSVKAGATLVEIKINEDDNTLAFEITDNGCGMTEEFLARVTDPFTTTRKTRSIGLGLPLLKMEAEMTGGSFSISSKSDAEYADHGTTVKATFLKDSIDYIPLGDIVGTVCILIQGAESIDFSFEHKINENTVSLKTSDMREMLGDDVPLSSAEVIAWVREYLTDCYAA